MNALFKKIALKVLSRYLDNYINPIQGSQLQLGLTAGNVELNDVSIKPTALSIHHLPFTVTSGIIQSIKLHFPWQSLKKQACVIEIDGIHIIANFTKDVELKSELEIKESVLQELEDAGLGDEKIKSVLFQGTVSQIISNIIINIKNIHIRVEIDTPDPNTFFAVGLMCKQIECFTISENGQQTFTQPDANIAKRIQIQDFSIYADPEPVPSDLPRTQEEIVSYLKMRHSEKHEYILDSFSFSTDYMMAKRKLQALASMVNQIDKIYFKITQSQMAVFGEYLFQYNLFQLRQKYSILGHPKNLPISEDEKEEKNIALKWWRFIHLCTIEKRYPNRINISESIQILKTRTNYYNIWKIRQSMNIQDFKKNSNYSKLKEIEDKLPLNSILFLRNYADYRINKEKGDKLVLDKSDLDMLTSTNVMKTSSDISLLINTIKMKIYEKSNDPKPILTLAIHEINSKFIQSFDKSLSFTLACKSNKIYSKDKIIFQQDSLNKSSVEIKYKYEPNIKEEQADLTASESFINVDLKFLYKLKVMLYDNGFNKCPSSSYFSFTNRIADMMTEEANKCTPYMIRKGQYANMILQKKCDEYPYMKIRMKLLSPNVKIQGASLSFHMKEINFESFPIHERFADQVDTLYISYLIKCTDFAIGLGENQILKPVSIDFNFSSIIAPVEWLDKFRIALNISSIAVVFNKDTYREIVSGLGKLLKLSQDFEQKEVDKVEEPKIEKQKNNYIDNVNMENLSTNFATKISILFNNISLELVSVGRFDIINFETQITASSNGLGLNLRIQNIICNSLENKYIFFNVNETCSDDHFLKENNAIVCQYLLFFDKAMKMNLSINSPTIIIDFGWIETTLDFFKSADIKALMLQPQTQVVEEKTDEIDIMESVMTNSIEFQLLKPTFKVILPAYNKLKDDVELTLNIDYITFGEVENQTKEGKKNMLLKMPVFSFEWKKRLTANINNFSILLGEQISLYFDDLTVFDIVEDQNNIELKPLKPNGNESKTSTSPFLTLQMGENKIDTTINDFAVMFDVNSYMIPELILSLLKSSVIAQIVSSFMDETSIAPKTEEEPSSSTMTVNIPNANIVLIDKDIKLNSHFHCSFTNSPENIYLDLSNLSLSFSEKEANFAPICENIALNFGIKEGNLLFSLSDANVYVSPSDIIDAMSFMNKILNLYSNFSQQLDYSKPIEEVEEQNESKPIKSLSISNMPIVIELCEDNRTTKVPFPFLRLSIVRNSNDVSLKGATYLFLLGFHIEIFNKNTQRWDLLLEPLEIYLSFPDTKHFNFEIRKNFNVIISHSILNQICQFKFERQAFDHKTVLPSFFVENDTTETCELVFDDDDNMTIQPQCLTPLKKTQPFKFMGTVIDPQNFYSPQFLSDKYSLSIFSKGKERRITISSPLLFKNRSNINLIYRERHTGDFVGIRGNSITPLRKLSAEFEIYGDNPQQKPQTINLFRLKERRRMHIPVQADSKTYYFYLSIKFSNKRGIVMITLTPKYTIRNHYKLPVTFTVDDPYQSITIPGKSKHYMNHAGSNPFFNLFIEANGHISQSTQLNLKNNTFIPVNFTSNSAFSIRFDNDIITIQPPLLAKNLTDLPVSIFDFQNNQILTLQTKNSEDFIGPSDFFKNNRIQLSIQIEGYERSELFDTTVGQKELYLKSLSCGLYIPIAVLLTIGITGIIYLKIDHLVYIRNETTEKLHFTPIDDDLVRSDDHFYIDPDQTKPIFLGKPDLKFMFDSENCEEKMAISLLNTIENRNNFSTLFLTQLISHEIHQNILSVDFQTSSTLPGYYIVIKNCAFPQPLILTNLLGEKNDSKKTDIVAISGYKSQKISIKPMSTSIISSRDLVGQKLKIFCYAKEFEIDLTKFTEPTKKTIEEGDVKIDIFFKLVCLENGSHLIIVSNEIENKPNKFNILSTHEISFSLIIPFISLNLIDNQMRELALIGFKDSSIHCQFTKDTINIDLQIEMFQIDDMYPDTIVPVAVFNSKPPFIKLTIMKENANMIFDLIQLEMKPLTFYIDINYIAELFSFFTTIKMKERDETADVSATSNKSSIPILIKEILIGKVEITASASSQTGRPTFHPFPYEFIMDYIPSVSNVYLGRSAFLKKDLSSDDKVLNKMLKDYYDPLISDIKSLVAANSISFVFKGISNVFHKMGDSSKIDVSFNQEKGKVAQRSFQSFGKGILNGVTGVVMKPVKGAKKDGAKGFFIGLGKGVGGIITDPLAGLIDAGTGVIDEIKNSLSESRNSMRFPRVFNNIQVQEYDDTSAICQLQYQRFAKNYDDSFVYFVNADDKFIGITESYIAYLVPNDQKKKNPSKKYKVEKLKQIAEIENISTYEKDLVIIFNDNYQIHLICKTPEEAEIATKIIVSRSYYSNYLSNSSSMTRVASTLLVDSESEIQAPPQIVCLIKDGNYSLKCSNGKYVTNDKESLPLIANRGSAKGWEKFKITNNDDGTISFLSVKNKKYVKVGSNSKLFASSTKIGRDEKFSVTKVTDNFFNFVSMKTGKYVSADRNKFGKLYANRDNAQGWEKFELVPRD